MKLCYCLLWPLRHTSLWVKKLKWKKIEREFLFAASLLRWKKSQSVSVSVSQQYTSFSGDRLDGEWQKRHSLNHTAYVVSAPLCVLSNLTYSKKMFLYGVRWKKETLCRNFQYMFLIIRGEKEIWAIHRWSWVGWMGQQNIRF